MTIELHYIKYNMPITSAFRGRICKFKASLIHRASFMTVRTTYSETSSQKIKKRYMPQGSIYINSKIVKSHTDKTSSQTRLTAQRNIKKLFKIMKQTIPS